MDRIQFIQSIECKDFEQSIVRFFDEHMLLYNLVREYKNINCIKGNIENETYITFDIAFNTIEDTIIAYEILNKYTQIDMYGNTYNINTTHKDIIIEVALQL